MLQELTLWLSRINIYTNGYVNGLLLCALGSTYRTDPRSALPGDVHSHFFLADNPATRTQLYGQKLGEIQALPLPCKEAFSIFLKLVTSLGAF